MTDSEYREIGLGNMWIPFPYSRRDHEHEFKFVDCARPLVCECGVEKGDVSC